MLKNEKMADFLTQHGLKVEGDETSRELYEAYQYMRTYLRGRGLL